jgi:hypothetical protein
VRGTDPGWRYVFSRHDCGPCPLRAQCTKSVRGARILQVTAQTQRLQRLRIEQRTEGFRRRYRRRVVVEHRIARLVQLGVRQARYLGQAKVAFQVALAAAVANLTLVQAAGTAICAAAARRAARTAGFRGLAWMIRPFRPVRVDRTSTVHAGLFDPGRLPNPRVLGKMAPSRPGF